MGLCYVTIPCQAMTQTVEVWCDFDRSESTQCGLAMAILFLPVHVAADKLVLA